MTTWLSALFHSYIITWLPYVVVFSASLFNPADADLGWHLKYGQYFFQYGHILRENILSTQMTLYHWVNHSWLTDIITYVIFKNAGFFGLSIAGALTITLTFYFIAKACRLSFWEKAILFPFLIYIEEPLFIVSFRSQLMSLLGIAILVFLLNQFETGKKKYLFFCLPLFLLWANIHGGFILGLSVFVGWILLSSIAQFNKNNAVLSLFVFIASIIATLVNPFGIGIYQESFRHFGNQMQKYIIEWIPLETYSQLWWILVSWGIVLSISTAIIIRKKLFRQKLPYIILAYTLYVLSFWMRRYAWTMYFVCVPVVRYLIAIITPPNKKLQVILPTLVLIVAYLYIIFFKNTFLSFPTMNWERYCMTTGQCSPSSAEFLRKQQFNPQKLLTFYNWGGWIIWNYPEIKPSIDGRMTMWRDEKGYSAFAQYYLLEQDLTRVDDSLYDIVWMPPTKPIYKQLTRLVEEGKWKEVYKDEYASVFERIKND